MAGKVSPIGPTGDVVRANIEEFRQGEGLSYAELSRRLKDAGREIPPLGLRRLEAGERKVDVDDLMAFAAVLNVAPIRLLMPATWSTAIEAEATGVGTKRTSELWRWALGYMPLNPSKAESYRYMTRSTPRQVRTREQRIEARWAWVESKVSELEDEMVELKATIGAEDQFMASSRIAALTEQIETLRELDIEDDNAFEEIGESDPAPPSPEELAGLLREEEDDA
ncbi:helix-turn-helix domain-containing protein [Brevibacterium casei]|uniref:Helix-turn-helix transcriptional regulator n=1 Tax=Brevibacterium casei TaxID=33889 RepID=A0A7T2WMX2_9MICO|nr:helix-turn-helix transcriptional regulator [Brevibacterium casei]QPS33986.1 helix-turn-helix transcriptional regulator [Brevibacterium casei]